MLRLPDDALLHVLPHTDIDTLLTTRLLSNHAHKLIDNHLRGLTNDVAHSSFPGQEHIFLENPQPVSRSQCLRWLKDLRYHQLAAMWLECKSEKHSISADDPFGTEVRHDVSEGFRLLDRFAHMAREVESMTVDQLPLPPPRRSTSSYVVEEKSTTLSIPKLRELEICRRRIQYAEQLTASQIKGYKTLKNCLAGDIFGFQDHPASGPAQ